MEIVLNHSFRYKCHNLYNLLNNCDKLSTFCTRLEKQAEEFPDRYEPKNYKGDGLELLVEALLKLSPVDNRLGISNYYIVEKTDDKGIDGMGIGIDGKLATVQVKYRANNAELLTANKDHLSNFVMTSLIEGVDKNSKNNMLLVTTADGLHHFTDNEMFGNRVRCIGYKQLKDLLDNNLNFWGTFRKLLNL